MNPAHIFLWILLIGTLPFLAGAFLIALFAIMNDEIFPKIEEDEED